MRAIGPNFATEGMSLPLLLGSHQLISVDVIATHKIFPTGSESLPVCCKKTTTGPPESSLPSRFFLDSAKDCVLFGRSTTFYVFLQHASSEARSARDR